MKEKEKDTLKALEEIVGILTEEEAAEMERAIKEMKWRR
jgi:hypothetical protein